MKRANRTQQTELDLQDFLDRINAAMAQKQSAEHEVYRWCWKLDQSDAWREEAKNNGYPNNYPVWLGHRTTVNVAKYLRYKRVALACSGLPFDTVPLNLLYILHDLVVGNRNPSATDVRRDVRCIFYAVEEKRATLSSDTVLRKKQMRTLVMQAMNENDLTPAAADKRANKRGTKKGLVEALKQIVQLEEDEPASAVIARRALIAAGELIEDPVRPRASARRYAGAAAAA